MVSTGKTGRHCSTNHLLVSVYSAENVRHVTISAPDHTDMLGTGGELNLHAPYGNWVDKLGKVDSILLVGFIVNQQFGLTRNEFHTILQAVELSQSSKKMEIMDVGSQSSPDKSSQLQSTPDKSSKLQ